jgi:hypothetical protein
MSKEEYAQSETGKVSSLQFSAAKVSGESEKEKVAPTPDGSFISRLKPLSLTFALAPRESRERTVKSTHAVWHQQPCSRSRGNGQLNK